ncbi:cuticle protein 8-like [Penaeus monodon]|uniref:cuticle protein 8-like n=1 Tax=Penaeus monodon TaxID=6687 RepID=UPI0018A6D526|nr:cuticle protein 8-like [Penaeus monodon]
MAAKIVFLAAMVGLIVAAPQYNYEPPQAPSSLYETPLVAEPQNLVPAVVSPPMQGMPYDFTWGVEDGDSGNAFSHVENSDGQTTQGEYRVLLPDGRTQVVKFYDNGDGFNAEVTYEK